MLSSSCIPVTHEAVSRGDPDILRMILTHRDIQKREQQSRLVPELLQRLKDVCYIMHFRNRQCERSQKQRMNNDTVDCFLNLGT